MKLSLLKNKKEAKCPECGAKGFYVLPSLNGKCKTCTSMRMLHMTRRWDKTPSIQIRIPFSRKQTEMWVAFITTLGTPLFRYVDGEYDYIAEEMGKRLYAYDEYELSKEIDSVYFQHVIEVPHA